MSSWKFVDKKIKNFWIAGYMKLSDLSRFQDFVIYVKRSKRDKGRQKDDRDSWKPTPLKFNTDWDSIDHEEHKYHTMDGPDNLRTLRNSPYIFHGDCDENKYEKRNSFQESENSESSQVGFDKLLHD